MEAPTTVSLSPVSPSPSFLQICFPSYRSSSSTPQLDGFINQSSTTDLQDINTRSSPQHSESSTPEIEDILTEDGILCSILSSLTLAEAVRTSVLSPRWRLLWTQLRKLDFDPISVLLVQSLRDHPLGGKESYFLTEGKTDKFIHSVYSILQQLQGSRFDAFQIRFFLDNSHSHHLDAWVRFAVESKAKLLRLHLFRPHLNNPVKPYNFPFQVIGSSSSIEKMSLIFCSLKVPFEFQGLKHLKRVVLINVHVNDEDFNRLFSLCPNLDDLGVWRAPYLTSISIPQPLNQLKTMIVQNCKNLRKIEINAVNFFKLEYEGSPVDFTFRQSTKLNDADIYFKTERTVHNLDFYLTKLTSSLFYLQSLTLKTTGVSKVTDLPKGSRRFLHLKKLYWEWNDKVNMNLLHLTTLLDVVPYLENLTLRFTERMVEQPPETPSKFRGTLTEHYHSHLKTVQVSGFYGDMWQLEIAAYLLNNATKLESMTIETCSKSVHLVSKEILERGMKILNQEAPASVKLAIV